MKLNFHKLGLVITSFSLIALSSNSALAHHWGANNDSMWSLDRTFPTAEQQASAQRINDSYLKQTSPLHQQLMLKRDEYNVLLTSSSPDSSKINALAKEISVLNQSLDEQQAKRDIAMAQAGVPRYTEASYRHRGGNSQHGHRGMGHW